MSCAQSQTLSLLQVKEAGLLLRPRLCRAVIADRKDQTRRVGPQAHRLLKLDAGDAVWFREPWGLASQFVRRVLYRADFPDGASAREAGVDRWRSSLHLARADARLVRALTEKPYLESLQDISRRDAIGEGTCWSQHPTPDTRHDVRECFFDTWDAINANRHGGQYAVAKNPEVVVVRFERGA